MSSTNKPVVLITGASSGFGMLSSLRFAAKGYQVIATMRDLRKNTDLMSRALQSGIDGNIICWHLDVTVDNEIESIVQNIEKDFGRLDILVNNAGFAVGGMVEEVPIDAWRAQLETNFFAVVRLSQAVLPLMRKQRSGKIFNIGSISGRIGIPGYAPYCASKYALEGFSESLRYELNPFGIHVVLIEPGAYKTQIWDKGFENIHKAPSSPYSKMMDTVLTYSRKTAESAPDPDEVARKIIEISALRKPKLRYAMGKGSRFSLIGKALLPWKLYELILLTLLNKNSQK